MTEKEKQKRVKAEEKFLAKAKKLHKESYEYRDFNYVNDVAWVTMKCEACGSYFFDSFNRILDSKYCCPRCHK